MVYNNTMNSISRGIYLIKNNKNQKTYTGSTAGTFDKRWKIHKSLLRNNKHASQPLQNSWNKHGEDCFSFIVLEDMPNAAPEEILGAEQWYLDNSKTHAQDGGGYNIGSDAIAAFAGLKHTEEHKARMSKISAARKHTPETKAKISRAHTGRKHTPEARANMGSPVGRVISIETREKIGRANAGENNGYSKLNNEKVRFARFLRKAWSISYKKLGRYFGVHPYTIFRAVNRKTWRHIR